MAKNKKIKTTVDNSTVKTGVKSGSGVIVYFNHPQGIVFDLPKGKKVKIEGSNQELKGKDMCVLAIGNFGSTVVEKEDWEYIRQNYSSMAIFKNGLIFATEDAKKGSDEIKEKAGIKTGFEPANPEDVDVKEADTEE